MSTRSTDDKKSKSSQPVSRYNVGNRNRRRKEFMSHSSPSTDEMKAEKNMKNISCNLQHIYAVSFSGTTCPETFQIKGCTSLLILQFF